MHVNKSLFTGCAGQTTERLCAKHCLVCSVTTTSFAHDEVIKVLELFLMEFESLTSVSFISKLLSQSLYDITETILKCFVHLCKVGLRIQTVLHLLHPLCELVSEMVESILKISYSLNECVKGFLADSIISIGCLRDFKVGKGLLQFQ